MPFLLGNVSRDGQQVIIYQNTNLRRKKFLHAENKPNLSIKINYKDIATRIYHITKIIYVSNIKPI